MNTDITKRYGIKTGDRYRTCDGKELTVKSVHVFDPLYDVVKVGFHEMSEYKEFTIMANALNTPNYTKIVEPFTTLQEKKMKKQFTNYAMDDFTSEYGVDGFEEIISKMDVEDLAAVKVKIVAHKALLEHFYVYKRFLKAHDDRVTYLATYGRNSDEMFADYNVNNLDWLDNKQRNAQLRRDKEYIDKADFKTLEVLKLNVYDQKHSRIDSKTYNEAIIMINDRMDYLEKTIANETVDQKTARELNERRAVACKAVVDSWEKPAEDKPKPIKNVTWWSRFVNGDK